MLKTAWINENRRGSLEAKKKIFDKLQSLDAFIIRESQSMFFANVAPNLIIIIINITMLYVTQRHRVAHQKSSNKGKLSYYDVQWLAHSQFT